MQIKLVISLGLIMLFGCQRQIEKKIVEQKNIQQEDFVSFVKKSCVTYETQSNDIQRREYFNQFEKDISKLTDTLGVFTNWKGKIKEIRTLDWNSINSTELHVEIEIKLSEYQNITFISKRIFSNKEIDSNLTYKQLKNLKIDSIVYFDGFIDRGKDTKFKYAMFMSYDSKDKICDPNILFYFISIGKDRLQFTQTEIFNNIITIHMNIWKTMEDKVSNKITETQFKNKLNNYNKKLDLLNESLTIEEKKYIKSFTDCKFSQFATR